MKINRLLFFILIAALVFAGCSPKPAPVAEPAQSESIVITDALGREVTLTEVPKRVAIVGRANLLVADAAYFFPEAKTHMGILGKGGQTGFNFLEMIDKGYADKPKFENEVSAEQLAGVKPDLVILKSYLAETIGKPIEAAGIPVVYIDLETPEQYTRDITMLGKLFGNPARAEEINKFYSSRHQAIKDKSASLKPEDKPRVLLLYYSIKDGVTAFNVPPMNWLQTTMAQDAGGDPVWKDASLGKGWTVVNLEQVAAWDPDQIYIISYNKPVGDVLAELRMDPTWQAMRAVEDDQLYGFPVDALSWDQADTRWILGAQWLATKVQPELFKDVDMKAEVYTFYKQMYGLNDAEIESRIMPLISGELN